MMPIGKSMARYYARRAAEYERIYQKPERQDELDWLRRLVAKELAGEKVLEVACGTGYWTQFIAKAAASVVAIDLNQEVLDLARAKGIDPRKVEFVRGDVYNLNQVSNQFTAGFAAFWWSHIPRRRVREFLSGLHQHLLPGSRIIFIDNCYVEGSSTPISRQDQDGNTYQLRKLDGKAIGRGLERPGRGSQDHIPALLLGIGLYDYPCVLSGFGAQTAQAPKTRSAYEGVVIGTAPGATRQSFEMIDIAAAQHHVIRSKSTGQGRDQVMDSLGPPGAPVPPGVSFPQQLCEGFSLGIGELSQFERHDDIIQDES
jgi:SAM-dependent methyltransferase